MSNHHKASRSQIFDERKSFIVIAWHGWGTEWRSGMELNGHGHDHDQMNVAKL
jgi:hypothetical protein